MKILSKKFTVEKIVGLELISAIIDAIVIATIFYFYLTEFSKNIQDILNNGKSPLQITLFLLPIFILVMLAFKIIEINFYMHNTEKNIKK